jgi:hypothetical protein
MDILRMFILSQITIPPYIQAYLVTHMGLLETLPLFSAQYLSIYPGDPTTPGYPSYENSTRIEGLSLPFCI